jgi:NAD(P)H-dependent flavin oxidoreductase YrpB (nitropropane dioxygenase family)
VHVLPGVEVELPVVAAPMAGGPTTPALVVAAARAGALGFLAGGYLGAPGLAERIAAVRAEVEVFGVNLFAPSPQPVDPAAFRAYAARLQHDASTYGLDLAGAEPVEDDDEWPAKLELLLLEPVPVVSFTFGLPAAREVRALQSAGTVVVQTVTSVDEARAARDVGADALAVQSPEAGGHYGTFTPLSPPEPLTLPDLVAAVASAARLPVVAAGGIGTAADVSRVLQAGAGGAMVGSVLLQAPEAGTSPPYRAALAAGDRETVVTRAFTGRPGRGLRNRFVDRYDAVAPSGYPALNHLTSPLRRAATAAGDAELVNLWAGTAYREGRPEPAAATLQRLAARG